MMRMDWIWRGPGRFEARTDSTAWVRRAGDDAAPWLLLMDNVVIAAFRHMTHAFVAYDWLRSGRALPDPIYRIAHSR